MLLSCVLLLTLGASGHSQAEVTASSARQITWGIDDQNPYLFNSAFWQQLPLHHVRYFVPWDLKHEPRYLRMANLWLAKARAHHAIPLIAITQSQAHGRTRYLPRRWEYRQQVHWIMAHFHWVREWTPWNEANLQTAVTLHYPATAAIYWRIMRQLCRSCTVTSPSLVGYRGESSWWLSKFLAAARGIHGPWAVHLYNDINEINTYALRLFKKRLHGPIWVTEVGGWKHFVSFPASLHHQTMAVAWMFKVAKANAGRVKRWYLYQWFGSPRGARWDSGVLNPNGSPRPALQIIQQQLLGEGF
jgi:Glycosyl hydrolase catalytic core